MQILPCNALYMILTLNLIVVQYKLFFEGQYICPAAAAVKCSSLPLLKDDIAVH